MAEIIYLKDVLLIKPSSTAKGKKRESRSRLKSVKTRKLFKASLIERKKEDAKTN